MAIPDYESLMLPILKYLSDDSERRTSEIVSHIANRFSLSEEEMRALIPSGRAKVVHNRVGWACTYLRKAGLIHSKQRGLNRITDDGRKVVSEKPENIDTGYLGRFEKFQDFRRALNAKTEKEPQPTRTAIEETPEEIIGVQTELLRRSIQKDLLEQIRSMEPDQFEQLVVDLLIAMGYGGTVQDAGKALGRTNDGGIDGIVNEDVLGLDTIYVQAKRWKNVVPIKEVRDFAGALLSKRSNKGVFITTSSFPSSAHEFVSSIERKIILIDGERLSNLMIEFNLGVSIRQTILIKEIDSDYFAT